MALSDAQARNLVIRALRNVRQVHRQSKSAGSVLERELDRLIARKTRINANSLGVLANKYSTYNKLVDGVQQKLTDALNAARQI